jgi:hypothetical protein
MGITHNLPGAIAKIRSLWDPLKLIPSSIDSPYSIGPSDWDLMLRSNIFLNAMANHDIS